MSRLRVFQIQLVAPVNLAAIRICSIRICYHQEFAVSKYQGLKENDWDKVASAICNCDCSNFKILYRIEERLMYLAIEKGNAKVILDRINEIEEKVA